MRLQRPFSQALRGEAKTKAAAGDDTPMTAAKAACPQNEPKNCSGSRPPISGLRVITDDPGATTWTEADSPAAVAVRSIVSLGERGGDVLERHVRESSSAIEL